ncbi:hypothetical protein Nmel_012760 [Mimus melanotis]
MENAKVIKSLYLQSHDEIELLSAFCAASFPLEYLLLRYPWPPVQHPCSQLKQESEATASSLIHTTAWSYHNETRL